MTDRATKPLTSEDLPALSVYVLTRFDDLTQTDDPTEVREVFEDFIAFAPDLARAATDLAAQLDAERFAHANTAVKVKRMEALADKLDREASEYLGRPVHSQAGDRIRAALNGGDQ